MLNNYLFEGVVQHGIALSGNPVWGYAGAFASGLILYMSRRYAHHTVHRAYITGDGKRLGFQGYNMLGSPGRKIEVAVGKAQFFTKHDKGELSSVQSGIFSRNSMPVKIEGLEHHLILDKEGIFHENAVIFDMLADHEKIVSEKSKSERLAWKRRGPK